MANAIFADTSTNTRKYVAPSVLGETAMAAIEKNPQGGQTEKKEEEKEEKKKRGGGGGGGGRRNVGYEAAVLPTATSQEQYINELYAAKIARERSALESAYDANVTELNRKVAAVPGQYQQSRNQAAGEAAMQKAAFHEQAAAGGLNTGARGQAALAQNNALLGRLSAIRQEERALLNEMEAQRMALQREYQQQIAKAVSSNEAERATALYNEAKRLDESMVETAVYQANENYKAWESLYG